MMLLVWTKIPIADDYVSKLNKKRQKKWLPKVYDKVFAHYFLYIPRGVILSIQGNVAHAGSFFWTDRSEAGQQSPTAFLLCPNDAIKSDVDKGKNTTCLIKGTPMMRISCMHCRTLSLTKLSYLPSQREWWSTCNRVFEKRFNMLSLSTSIVIPRTRTWEKQHELVVDVSGCFWSIWLERKCWCLHCAVGMAYVWPLHMLKFAEHCKIIVLMRRLVFGESALIVEELPDHEVMSHCRWCQRDVVDLGSQDLGCWVMCSSCIQCIIL